MLTSYLLANLILPSSIISPFLGEKTQGKESQTLELMLLISLSIVCHMLGVYYCLLFLLHSSFLILLPNICLSPQPGYNTEFKNF